MTRYYVPEISNNQADVFAAAGLAQLLLDSGLSPLITREGRHFIIESDIAVDTVQDCVRLAGKQLYRYIIKDDQVERPARLACYDLPVIREIEAEKRQQREILKEELRLIPELSRSPEIIQRRQEYQQDPEYRMHSVFKSMQTFTSANKVLEKINKKDETQSLLIDILNSLRSPNNSIPNIKLGATPNQLINPHFAKGCWRPKPDATTRSNLSLNDFNDNEFLQYLRYAGYFKCAAPFLIAATKKSRASKKKKPLHLLTPVPQHISLNNIISIIDQMRTLRFGGKSKVDVLASIEIARLLVENSEFGISKLPELLCIRNQTPADIIAGIYVTHYMPMQHVWNLIEMSFLPIPGWFTIQSNIDALAWREILNEHRNILRKLSDDISEEVGLIQEYRAFLQTDRHDALEHVVIFMAHYGAYWMSAVNDKHKGYIARFTTTGLERMAKYMGVEISEILAEPAFKAIAKAIRIVTVNAQTQKAISKRNPNAEKPWRDIRYGLIAELNRKRFVQKEFIESLSIFISQYNYENARRREDKGIKSAPRNITVEEMERFINIIDKNGSPIVGALLCAYGTCREPNDKYNIDDEKDELDTTDDVENADEEEDE